MNTLSDVIKVFFKIEEFELWTLILQSHALYSPPEHLLDHFKKAYSDYDLLNAFKTLTLVHSFNEKNLPTLHHYLRVLYSPAETL